MSDYEALRALAGTWGLLYFGVIFIAVAVYALWPSKGRAFDEAAHIPLRED
ncbi:cbb3-type cytochrome c oxidase subunit 3 [Methylocella sp.]|uniref:cbb3-type cytochrome c oxidase subunit 3 n=1 Tax=Methylocella sp. TaxID=1978226 RepID=UPI0035B295DB